MIKRLVSALLVLLPLGLHITAAESESFKKAEDFFKQGKLEMSLLYYNKEIAQNPDNATAYFNRAKILFQNRDFAGSLSDAQKAQELQPKKNDILFLIANNQAMMSKADEAIASYQKLLERDPGYTLAYLNMGNVYLRQKKDKSSTINSWETFLAKNTGYEQSAEISKAIEYLRDPAFSFGSQSTDASSSTNSIGNNSAASNDRLVIPDFLPEIKGEGSKEGPAQQKGTADGKSIETE